MSERTVVHLMRHGEVHNPQGVLYGRLPGYHLSELGAQMAAVVGDHLAAHDITRVVASSLERAQETAAAVAAPHELTVSTDDRVVEAANWFEGKTFGAGPGSLARPAVWPRLVNPFRPSWGEPYSEIVARMLPAVADARDAARGHEVVIVSHQLPIWTTRCQLEGRRLWHDPRSRECSLASLTSLEYSADELRSITYCEPARHLLPGASAVVGA